MEHGASETTLRSILSQIDSFLDGPDEDQVQRSSEGDDSSLVEQLNDLYAEIETAGGRPSELAEENAQLLEDMEALRRQIEGLESAYSKHRESGGDASLVAQLEALYRDIEAADGKSPSEQKVIISELVEQLHSLYAEREAEASSGSIDSDFVDSLVEQLHALYAEKESAEEGAGATIDELDEQLSVFIEEKLELEAQVGELTQQLDKVRRRARALGVALMDSMIAA